MTGTTLDENEWSGLGNGGDLEVPVSLTDEEGKRTGTGPKKPPTGEELRTIKDATDLYRSGSFKLQIDALLPNVRPKVAHISPLDSFLLVTHAFIMSIPSVAPRLPLEAARSLVKHGVSVPYSLPLPTKDALWKVSFEKPASITLVGSWANKVSVKGKDGSKFGVDLAVEMPESLFQEKDYLDGRFFHKRAFYIATLAAAIQSEESGLGVNVSYGSAFDDPRLTVLVLSSLEDSPNDFSKLNAQVRIIPVLPQSSPIPLHRLSPSHPNIRISTASDEGSTIKSLPTPLYNTTILTALTATSNLLMTHSFKQSTPAFSDALTLLRVWANQRGYGEGSRLCVRGFEGRGFWWGAVLGLLIAGEEPFGSQLAKGKKKKPLGRGLSSYQLFKAAVDFLAKQNFESEPVYLKTKDGHQFPPEEYRTHHEAIFVDSSSMVNLLAGIPISSLEMLSYDANETLELLNHSSISEDPFTQVYLKEQRDLPTRFDAVIRVDLLSAKLRRPSLHATFDHGSSTNALLASLASLIRRGLGNRSKAIAILHPTSQPRPIAQSNAVSRRFLHIGLIYDLKHAFRLVDHGPAADDPDPSAAEVFRDFWGDKAELRRFKDGRIIESVVWDVKTSDERAHVPSLVVRHVLARHFGLTDAVQTWQSSFDNILKLPDMVSRQYQASGVATGFKGAIDAFDMLVKVIKAVDDELPLALLNISAASEYLRYTSVFSPVPVSASVSISAAARYLPSMEIVLEFEKSSKWPDDLRAIQKIKLAFFERLATVLMKAMVGIQVNVVVGDGMRSSEIQDNGRMEIVTPDGWAFTARIWHEREATLLDRIIDTKSRARPHVTIVRKEGHEVQGREYQDALMAKEVYSRRFIYAPRHHRAIASLCHHFPAYAGTVRLVKRWLASHWLLRAHISEEVVEIICASLFVGHGKSPVSETGGDVSANVPGSRERGFSAIVEFLKNWKWERGLFVPLYGNAESDGLSNSPKTGMKLGVWTVLTEVDMEGHVWTSCGPDAIAACRVRALAKATWDCLQGMEHGHLNIKTIFMHPTKDYDFLIHLDPAVLPRYFQNVIVDPGILTQSGRYANLSVEEACSAPTRPGFDPAQMLFDDIKYIYADTLKLFYDPFGGDRFGAVWDFSLKNTLPFRVLGGFSGIPNNKGNNKKNKAGSVTLNKSAVLSEIERMGSGLVREIIVQT